MQLNCFKVWLHFYLVVTPLSLKILHLSPLSRLPLFFIGEQVVLSTDCALLCGREADRRNIFHCILTNERKI